MKNIAKIIKIARPLRHIAILIAILILIGSSLELVTPLISKMIVDEIVAKVQTHSGSVNDLAWLIGLSFVIGLIQITLTAITERIGDHFAGRLRKFLTERFYDKVLSLPQTYFDSEISGKIVNQLNRGIQTIQVFINSATNFILPMFLQSLFTIGIMLYFNVWIAVFVFLLFPVYLIISHYSTKKWGEEEVKKNKIEDFLRGRIQEVIGNIKLVKSFNTEKLEYKHVEHGLTESNKIYARQSKSFHIFDFLRNFSLTLVLLGVNIVVFYNTFVGKLTIGEMVLILQLVQLARRPLFAMSFILTRIQEAESGSKEYLEVLDLPSTEDYNQEYSPEKLKDATIEFKNVSFKYETSDLVLKDISFKIDKHEQVALVGHSGVGKSTIVNLILKFYEPTAGHIHFKDRDYDKVGHQFIRSNIALVFQENELFSSTIRENVGYGSKPTEEQIERALKLANAWDFVQKLPNGIDTEVGERGVRLSGGQKQRIQIARAILKDAPILILDEATSSLDAKSEKDVQDGLENLMKNKLVIVIAHRFSTIQNVDKIIVIDNGKIVDYGNPQELAHRKGIYSDLLQYQVEGNKKLLAQFEIY